jgi:hypothetical protein
MLVLNIGTHLVGPPAPGFRLALDATTAPGLLLRVHSPLDFPDLSEPPLEKLAPLLQTKGCCDAPRFVAW